MKTNKKAISGILVAMTMILGTGAGYMAGVTEGGASGAWQATANMLAAVAGACGVIIVIFHMKDRIKNPSSAAMILIFFSAFTVPLIRPFLSLSFPEKITDDSGMNNAAVTFIILLLAIVISLIFGFSYVKYKLNRKDHETGKI
jgi:cytochrome bd-type quinol oxidase subunit 2